jgi:hypothetical protein
MGVSWKDPEFVCIECGGPIEDGLARLGSALCHDCRDEQGVDVIVARRERRLVSRRRARVRSIIPTLRRR